MTTSLRVPGALCGSLIVVLLMSGCGEMELVYSERSDAPLVRHGSLVGTQTYQFEVNKTLLVDSPEYDFSGPPPLSVHEAVALARGAAPRYFQSKSEYDEWQIADVSLHRLSDLSKWYYLVVFEPPASRGIVEGAAQQLRIPVLFNGQVVRGKKREF